MVAPSQTVEDMVPRYPATWTLHQAGTPREFCRVDLVVTRAEIVLRSRLVIRVSQGTGEVTAALETLSVVG